MEDWIGWFSYVLCVKVPFHTRSTLRQKRHVTQIF